MSDLVRVGILCVHGMGNQGSGEHVAGVARGFYESLKKHYGLKNVSIGYEQGGRNITFYVQRNEGKFVQIELVEGYWRDLGEPRTITRLLKFWWWALTLWATTGFHFKKENTSGLFGSIALRERLRLLFYSMVFFILLLPFRLILTVLSYIPFVSRIDLFATIYSYMSSVKIYQEKPSTRSTKILLEEIEPRRVWIQRRFAHYVLYMANKNYDRWGIFCHSLGSVIVYKGLQYGPEHWAWFLDQGMVQKYERFLVPQGNQTLTGVDIPNRPLYLRPSANAVNRQQLFSKFIGVVSYGSPIETFAKLWPKLLENPANSHYFNEFKLVNLYDIRDFISSPIRSAYITRFGNVVNIPVDSHWLIFKAHTEYLLKTERNREVSYALFRWFIDNDSVDLDQTAETKGNRGNNSNVVSLIVQAAIVLIIGVSILPLATATFFSLTGHALGSLIRYVLGGPSDLSALFDNAAVNVDPFANSGPDLSKYVSLCEIEVSLFVVVLIAAGVARRVIKLIVSRNPYS